MKPLIVLAAALFVLAANVFAQDFVADQSVESTEISYSDLRTLIDDGNIRGATIYGDGWWVGVLTADGSKYHTHVTPNTPIADRLVDAGIKTVFRYKENKIPVWLEVFLNLLPLLIFLAFFGFIMFTFKRKNNGYFSRAEKINADFLERLEKLLIEQKSSNG